MYGDPDEAREAEKMVESLQGKASARVVKWRLEIGSDLVPGGSKRRK